MPPENVCHDKAQNRSDLLKPLKRRLSGIASQLSVAASKALTAESTPVDSSFNGISDHKAGTPFFSSYQAPEVAASPNIGDTKTCPGHKRRASVASEPCSPKTQPFSSQNSASDSAWWLNAIRQSSAGGHALDNEPEIQTVQVFEQTPEGTDHSSRVDRRSAIIEGHDQRRVSVGRLGSPFKERYAPDHSQLSVIAEDSGISHSGNLLGFAVPQNEPTVSVNGPSGGDWTQNLSHSHDMWQGASSLRATAAPFVPVITQRSSVNPRLETQRGSGNESNHEAPGSAVDVSAWLPPNEWHLLSAYERNRVKEQRRMRGSSVSSSGLSAWSRSDGSGSPEKGRIAPAKFGRSPLPTMAGNEKPTRSKGWGIGSAAPGWWYGWRGGDGLEISFTGHGPDAERNSYAPVNFHNYDKQMDEQGTLPPAHKRRNANNSSDDGLCGVPAAPKKMREWAARAGYPRVPCGNFEITDAIEHVGNYDTRGFVDGWCHGCVPGH
ncbi:hypothetical protein MBLNU459_g1349t1 [Dothideomycetes sp. NU459]